MNPISFEFLNLFNWQILGDCLFSIGKPSEYIATSNLHKCTKTALGQSRLFHSGMFKY